MATYERKKKYHKTESGDMLVSQWTASDTVEMSDGTNLQEKVNDIDQIMSKKANIDSPNFTGTPKAPTASVGTNTTQVATTAFVQTAVANLVDSAPETMNTLDELSQALGDDPNFATTVANQIGTKANTTDLNSHIDDSTMHITNTERDDWNLAKTHADSAHAPSDAQANQNAFSNITVGSTTIAADTTTDTLTLVAGSNVTITPDTTTDEITISSNHPTISQSTDSTSTASPSPGDSFTAVDSITKDEDGHVTQINTKTVTLPTTSVIVDSELSSTSTNPVQNSVVTNELNALNSKFAIVNGKTHSNSSPNITTYPYPNGFNKDNCVIIGTQYLSKDGFWLTSNTVVNTQLRDGYVSIYFDGTEKYRGVNVKVLLMKI